VLGADEVKPLTLNWTVHEFNGGPIHLYDGTAPKQDENGEWIGLEKVTEREALKPGTEIITPGMFGELILMTVEADEHGELHGRSQRKDGSPGHLIGLLVYGEDERGIWACVGWVNMKGIKKLELMTDD